MAEYFDHAEFQQKKRMLLEAQLEDNRFEGFEGMQNNLCVPDTDIDSEMGTKPIEELAYSYGRVDRSSQIADGDRAVVYNSELGTTSWRIHSFMAARQVRKNQKITLDAMTGGGWLNRMTEGAGRQVYTDVELEFHKVVAGLGTDANGDAPTIIAITAGDEFNDATPAKTPEAYLQDGVRITDRNVIAFMGADVWDALLTNPNIGENNLNQHSMTDEELTGWFRARGVSMVIVSSQRAQQAAPEQGFNRDYIHSGVFCIGQPGAVIRYALGQDGIDYDSAHDQMAKTDYVLARADIDFRVPYKPMIVAYTNVLA